MSRTVGLDDLPRVAELIDQTVVLLRYGNGPSEWEILTGLAERIRVDHIHALTEKPDGPTGMVEPSLALMGRVARVTLGRDERVRIAEVRNDFGGPAWAGSWHGFTLAKGQEINVVEWVS